MCVIEILNLSSVACDKNVDNVYVQTGFQIL